MMAASNHDDLDMAKLQKKIRQQQRHSLKARNAVTKLTPAEIRSLHHSVTLSKEGSRQTSHRSTPSQGLSSNSDTPPLTPENIVANHKQISRNSSVNLPTPPQSPDTAHESRRNSNPTNGYTHIHAPKPHPYSTAQFVSRGPTSRPSSASSYRGMQTYRGPEVTRTGSLTMLHQPPPDIVSNPLSQFSRPRRSQTGTSPDRRNSRHSATSVTQDQPDALNQALSDGSIHSIRTTSPQKFDDSPVSALEATESMGFPTIIRANASHSDNEVAILESPAVDDRPAENRPISRTWSWRRSMSGQRPDDADLAAAKKNRRHTLSFSKRPDSTQSVAYADTKPGIAPTLRDSLKGELPSNKSYAVDDQNNAKQNSNETIFNSHPSVRPLNIRIPENTEANPVEVPTTQQSMSIEPKGKGRETEGTPMYGRCSCCGKLKKPNGFHSELSPVIENENLRTNFNFEADRTSIASKRRSSSAASSNRRRYTPIIPMAIGEDRTVQASIEPYPEVFVNEVGDVIASNAEPVSIQSRRPMDSKMVRFSSLHGRKLLSTAQENGTLSENNDGSSTADEHLGSSEIPGSHSTPKPQNDPPESVIDGSSTQAPVTMQGPLPSEDISSAGAQLDNLLHGSQSIEKLQESQSEPQKQLEPSLAKVVGGTGNAETTTEPATELTKNKAIDSAPNTPKSRFRNKLKTKETAAAVQVTELTPVSIPNNKEAGKPQDTSGQSSSAKSPQKASAFSVFKRHRKTTSKPELPSNAVPLVETLSNSTTTNEFASISNEPVTSPVQPVSAHNLVTVPTATDAADRTPDLGQKETNSATIQPNSNLPTSTERILKATAPQVQSEISTIDQNNADIIAASTTSPSNQAEPSVQEARIHSTSVAQPENKALIEARSVADTPQLSYIPAQPWPLPETSSPTTVKLEADSNETTKPISLPSADSSHEQDFLPMPRMGPHFARSSATLRKFVIPRGKSSNNLLGTNGSEVRQDENGNHTANNSIYAQ